MATLGRSTVLADSGPLAALFNSKDHFHSRSIAYFQNNAAHSRFITTWEVVSEVMYFLNFSSNAQADFLDWIYLCHSNGSMEVASLIIDDLPGLSAMMRKYSDRPMDLADASLVWLANKTGVTAIITIDRSDFAVYRTVKRKAFKNVFV